MSDVDTKHQTDMALILEGRIRERVNEVLQPMVERVVVNLIGKELARQWDENKQKMQMEIAVQLGKIIGSSYEDQHKPLWEYKPEDFGMTHADLNNSHMGKIDAAEMSKMIDGSNK